MLIFFSSHRICVVILFRCFVVKSEMKKPSNMYFLCIFKNERFFLTSFEMMPIYCLGTKLFIMHIIFFYICLSYNSGMCSSLNFRLSSIFIIIYTYTYRISLNFQTICDHPHEKDKLVLIDP